MQVLASSPPKQDSVAAFLPDDLPGQANSSASSGNAVEEPFSLFAATPQQMSSAEQLQRPYHRSAILRDPQTVRTRLNSWIPKWQSCRPPE